MTFDLSSLNDQQRQAVTTTEGPLLVLAGAGSGKTRVITARIAYLMREKRVAPEAILAVTFTNKAAREMARRVARLTRGGGAGGPMLCTFHAFGVRLLRAHIDRLGYRPGFAIFDSQDQQSVVKTLMEEGDYELGTLSPKDAHYALQNAKSRGLSARELLARHQQPLELQLGRLLAEYDRTLQRFNAIDFEDILLLSLRLVREHGAVAGHFFSRFSHVLVDEYQDTNRAQYELLRAVTARHGNLCVVGDDDQSIYRWRGAEPGNILDFERDFPGAVTVRLEDNYRSSGTILAAANQVIRHAAQRREKTLRPTRGPGRLLEWLLAEDEPEEMERVTLHLRRTRQSEDAELGDFAVLFRSNHQSRMVEEALREAGIPYRLVGGTRFYERREVKDALAYLRLVTHPGDEVSLLRVLNFPRRGIGRTSQARLMEMAAGQKRPALAVCGEAGRHAEFGGAAGTAMERFAGLIERYRQRFRTGPLGAVFRDMLAEVGFHRAVEKEQNGPQGADRAVGLIYELERAVDQFAARNPGAGIGEYLEHVTLLTLPEEDEEAGRRAMVSLMTVHAAKGLEFPYVYLVQMAEEVFPNKRSLAEDGADEERRLFYVAVTRARRQLVFSMAKSRRRYGETLVQQPSRFLLQIDPGLFDGPAPAGGAEQSAARQAGKAKEAKGRFFDQMRRLRSAGAGD